MKMEKKNAKEGKKKKKEKILKKESHEIFLCSHQASLWLFFNISTQEGKNNKKKKKSFPRCYRNI